ncbi:MAG: hypothetical protein JWQ21_1730 [Herminiimonas sp.]|nr:hypothetical protein [Herminiimonas sp.]
MALATQCPHCHTTFRVAHDQLKLRAGLVRCGACKEIFNGVEHLLRPAELPQSAAPEPSSTIQVPTTINPPSAVTAPGQPAIESPQAAPATQDKAGVDSAETGEPAGFTDMPAQPPAGYMPSHHVAAGDDTDNDPLQRMTLMDFNAFDEIEKDDTAKQDSGHLTQSGVDDPDKISFTEENADAPDELSRAIDDLQRKPWRGAKKPSRQKERSESDTGESAEPDFVKRARRQQRFGRALRIMLGAGSFVLLFGLIAQGAYIFRNQIAVRLPQTAPTLAHVCNLIGCRLELPAQIDAVSIESSELQALTANQNTFVLTTLLRNRSEIIQAWPNIELTLNDANEKAIVRRVFTARDYLLAAPDLKKGFAANSEQPIKLFFELSQLKASGYRVYLFYP